MHFECDFSPFRIQTLSWAQNTQDIKRMLFNGRNRTERANFRGRPLFQAMYNIKTGENWGKSVAAISAWWLWEHSIVHLFLKLRACIEVVSVLPESPSCYRCSHAGFATLRGWTNVRARSSLLQCAPRTKEQSWCSKKALQRNAEETACADGNQSSVMSAGGLRLRHVVLIFEKDWLWVWGRAVWSCRGKTQATERASSLPVILSPSLRLSKMQ